MRGRLQTFASEKGKTGIEIVSPVLDKRKGGFGTTMVSFDWWKLRPCPLAYCPPGRVSSVGLSWHTSSVGVPGYSRYCPSGSGVLVRHLVLVLPSRQQSTMCNIIVLTLLLLQGAVT